MPTYYTAQYSLPTSTPPINVPSKAPAQIGYGSRHQRASSAYSQYSVSPPEHAESVSASSGAGLYSSASSQYGGSDYDSASIGATGVDVLDYMNDRLAQVYDPIPLDRNIAKQAQMSGELNAKNRELLALQQEARARLARSRAKFAEGMSAAKEVQRDLEWTQKRISSLNARAAAKYPDQYRVARERYPTSTPGY